MEIVPHATDNGLSSLSAGDITCHTVKEAIRKSHVENFICCWKILYHRLKISTKFWWTLPFGIDYGGLVFNYSEKGKIWMFSFAHNSNNPQKTSITFPNFNKGKGFISSSFLCILASKTAASRLRTQLIVKSHVQLQAILQFLYLTGKIGRIQGWTGVLRGCWKWN